MALSRSERFSLKSQIIERIETDPAWTFQRINLLLGEYGFQTLDVYDNHGEFTFADSIRDSSDQDLLELYSVISGIEPERVQSQIETVDSSLWKPGYLRLFLSHSAQHKQFVGMVADELAISGIHAFVAHDTMEYGEPWQDQIEHGLRSMQAFAAITHPEFLESPWCQQEVGWALGRGVPRYFIRYPADPTGFVSRTQWPQAATQNHKRVAQLVLDWVSGIPEFADQILDGLLAALGEAGNYMDAGAAASRIATLGNLTPAQWSALDEIYWRNSQVYGAGLVARELMPFYQRNSRTWPPPKPSS